MSVLRYYFEHFEDLSPDKRFHFATRLKNWAGLGFLKLPPETLDYFASYIANNHPETNLSELLQKNDFKETNFLNLRKTSFEKYPSLYGLETTLFRIHHLINEYNIDLRDELAEIIPEEELELLVENLLDDPDALALLSTYAVNTLCLLDRHFFQIGDNIYEILADIITDYAQTHPTYSPSLYIYFITHLIICDSGFYTEPVPKDHLEVYRTPLKICEQLIIQNYKTIPYDAQIEFLVACRLTGYKTPIKLAIKNLCSPKHTPYVIDPLTPARNSLETSEHRNILYILAGLDD